MKKDWFVKTLALVIIVLIVCISFQIGVLAVEKKTDNHDNKIEVIDEYIEDNLKSSITEECPKVDFFKNTIPQKYINVRSNKLNYYSKWISPLQSESPSFISTDTSRASSKIINDIPQFTYNGQTLYVGGTGPRNYSTIQAAVWAARDGDTIYVYEGSYLLWPKLSVKKSIRLLGENPEKTIINGRGSVFIGRPVVSVEANFVTVSGFTIQRNFPTSSFIIDIRDCGVWIRPVIQYTTISNNIFTNSICGVILSDARVNTISNNSFMGNFYLGLYMNGASDNIIENNSFFDEGVRLKESTNNKFFNNFINSELLVVLEDEENALIDDAGQVVLIGCNNITVVNTTISGAYIGICLQHSQYCSITGNYLGNCFEGGIYLEWSDNNNITNNVIDNCYVGLLLGDSRYNKVQMNHIKGNIECPMIMSMAEQNVIDHNTFDNNTDLLSMLYGIYLTGGTNNNDITNNILINDTFYIHNAWQNRFINNTINGKPFIYLEGASGNVIDYPAGQIIMINCDSIEVRNQPDIVIYVFGCNHCLFDNMSLRTNKVVSLYILNSQYINITNCVFSEGGYGVQIRDGSHFVIQNSRFRKNIYIALSFVNCTDVSVEHNSFEENGGYTHPSLGPVFFGLSKSVEVRRNNFLGNVKGALFDQCKRRAIIWDGNYWDQPRMLPKAVPGIRFFLVFFCIYRFDFDWHPAQEPYDIP